MRSHCHATIEHETVRRRGDARKQKFVAQRYGEEMAGAGALLAHSSTRAAGRPIWRAIIGMAVHWDVAAWPERADGSSRRGRRRRRDRDHRRRHPRGRDATAPSLRTTQWPARGAHHRCEPGRCHASVCRVAPTVARRLLSCDWCHSKRFSPLISPICNACRSESRCAQV